MEVETREFIEDAVRIVKKLAEIKAESKSSILDTEEFKIRLLFTTHLTDGNISKMRTIKIPVPHAVIRKNAEVCLFVGDGKTSGRTITRDDIKLKIEEIQDKLTSAGIDQITEIIPLLKLKLEYKEFESKRNLSKGYDLFLAEDRIIRLLPDLLGKSFFGRKKYTVPVQVRAKTLVDDIRKILSNTFCYLNNNGNSHSVVIGDIDMTVEQLTENFQAVLKKLARSIAGGAMNIKSVHIKGDSKAVPIFMEKEVDLAALKELMKEKPARQALKRPLKREPGDFDLTTISGSVKVAKDGTIYINKTDGTKMRITADGSTDREEPPEKKARAEVNRLKKAKKGAAVAQQLKTTPAQPKLRKPKTPKPAIDESPKTIELESVKKSRKRETPEPAGESKLASEEKTSGSKVSKRSQKKAVQEGGESELITETASTAGEVTVNRSRSKKLKNNEKTPSSEGNGSPKKSVENVISGHERENRKKTAAKKSDTDSKSKKQAKDVASPKELKSKSVSIKKKTISKSSIKPMKTKAIQKMVGKKATKTKPT